MKKLSFEEKTVDSKLIFEGKIVKLKVDDIRLPDGSMGFREVIEHSGAAAILAITEEKKIIMVRQFRYPIKQELIEIPAGKVEPGEDPLDCAKRELEEETGYVAEDFKLLAKYYTSVGFSNELLYLYLATGLTKSSSRPDQDEFLEVVEYDMARVREILEQEPILDSKTLIAFLFLQTANLI